MNPPHTTDLLDAGFPPGIGPNAGIRRPGPSQHRDTHTIRCVCDECHPDRHHDD